jgi:hypothetical protein
MICYNIVLNTGEMANFVFLAALSELPIMGVIAFLLDTFIAGPIAKKMAFRMFTPGQDKPIFIILGISACSIMLMCPLMSFAATILFNGGFGTQTFATWVGLTVKNFPMAFFWQLFAAGPLVRFLFGKMFAQTETKRTENREVAVEE